MSRLTMIDRRRAMLVLAVIVLLAAWAIAMSPAKAAEHTHTVQWGDTLSQIAADHGMSVDQLVALNGLDDPDLIFPGEEILLHTEGSAQAASADVAAEPVSDVATDASADMPGYDPDYRGPTDGWAQGGGSYPPYYEPWDIQWLLEFYAGEYGIDPNLVKAQAWQESYWRQDQVSWTGAVGVMQIMPGTAAELNDWYFGPDRDPFWSVQDNIEMGVAYLSILYEETGDIELALASYYQGWGSVQRDGFFPDTEEYVQRVFMFQEMFASGELP